MRLAARRLSDPPRRQGAPSCPQLTSQSRPASMSACNRCYADVIMKDVKPTRLLLSLAFCSSIDRRKTTEPRKGRDCAVAESVCRDASQRLYCVSRRSYQSVRDDSWSFVRTRTAISAHFARLHSINVAVLTLGRHISLTSLYSLNHYTAMFNRIHNAMTLYNIKFNYRLKYLVAAQLFILSV